MATLPTFPSEIILREKFPFPEGQQWEFKAGTGFTTEKMHETFCGFLNSSGGYFIVGISDAGTILGLSQKECDKVLLKVDSAIHTKRIINSNSGQVVSVKELNGFMVNIKNKDNTPTNLFLAIVKVQNENPDEDFQMSTGEFVYRLNASNYVAPKGARALLDVQKINTENKHLVNENNHLVNEKNRLTNLLEALKRDLNSMNNANKELMKCMKKATEEISKSSGVAKDYKEAYEKEVVEKKDTHMKLSFYKDMYSIKDEAHKISCSKIKSLQDILFQKILEEKERVEKKMKEEKQSSWIYSLLC